MYRWADGDLARLPALASDLVGGPVDVMLVAGPAGVHAALQATRTVPIVVAIMGDPVALGFAASLARPGGRVTGLTVQFEDLATKQVQSLRELVPKAARIAILAYHTSNSLNPNTQKAATAAARVLGLEGRVFEIRTVPELEDVFRGDALPQRVPGTLLPSLAPGATVPPHPFPPP